MDPLVALAQLPATPAVADARTSVHLTVVDATGQPAAVLVVLPRGLPPELRAQRNAARAQLRDDPLRALAATALLSGTRYELATDGSTTVAIERPCTVLATTRSTCALLDLAPLPPPKRLPAAQLVLRSHRRIDVAVALADGTAAVGVLVAASATDNRADPWQWSTGPDGLAHVELPNLGDAFGLGHLHVVAALRSEVGSAVADLDADRVRFRLPPCGTVRVTVADDAVAADQQLRFALHRGIGRVPPTEADVRTATFALVEAGATTIAAASILGTDAELTAPVPIVAAGATAEVRLEAIAPRLLLRLCDATGAPLANTRVVTL